MSVKIKFVGMILLVAAIGLVGIEPAYAVVNIKDFGAIGDGVTDDTNAIQSALNTGKGVYVPEVANPSTQFYKITAVVSGTSNQKIFGDGYGSIIRQTTNNINALEFYNKSNFVVEGIHVWQSGTSIGLSDGNGIQLVYSNNGTIKDCYLSNCGRTGVLLTNSNRCQIDGNYFLNAPVVAGNQDIAIQYSGNENVISNNHCISGGDTGIVIQTILAGDTCWDNVITDNEVLSHSRSGIVCYKLDVTSQLYRTIVSNNIVKDIGDRTYGPYGNGIYIQGAEYTVVTGNNIYNTNNFTTSDQLAPGAIGSTNLTNIVITSNYISSPKWYGITVRDPNGEGLPGGAVVSDNIVVNSEYAAIHVMQRGNVIIDGNFVQGSKSQGILVANTTSRDNVTIKGNTVVGSLHHNISIDYLNKVIVADNLSVGAAVGGLAMSNINGVTISGNLLKNNATAGLTIGGAVTDCIVSNNQSLGNNYGMSIDVPVKLIGNRVYGNTTQDWIGAGGIIRTFASGDSTPSVKDGEFFGTQGTTTIINFDDGVLGQTITVKATGSITIQNNANIKLSKSLNFAMGVNDTVTLTMFDNGIWLEVARGDK